MPRWRALWLAALVLTLPAPALAASPTPSSCPPGVGIGLLEVPQARAADPRAQSYIIDHVAPGASFSRRFQVCNGTSSTAALRLYAAAADVRDGQFLLDVSPPDNDVSRAITVAPGSLVLAPGERGIATARFAVPRDAAAGEQYAVVYAELDDTGGAQVKNRSRVGIRVYLDVARGGEPRSDFRINSLQAGRTATGASTVTASVANTGARALDLVGELALRDGPGQLSAGPFAVTRGTTIGVGQTQQVVVPLPAQIAGGPWTADLVLRSGLLTRRASAVVTFPEGTATVAQPVPAVPVSAPAEESIAADHRILVPLAGGLLGLVALLLLVVGYLTSRRRAREREGALVDWGPRPEVPCARARLHADPGRGLLGHRLVLAVRRLQALPRAEVNGG